MRKKNINCKRVLNRLPHIFTLIAMLFVVWPGNSTISAENRKPRLYLKASGTFSPSKNGDINNFVKTNTEYYDDLKGDTSYTASLTDKDSSIRPSGEIGLEVKRFAIGVSVDSTNRQFQTNFNQITSSTGAETHSLSTYKFTSVPIYLMFHYKLVESSLVTASLSVGQGVHLTKFRDDYSHNYKNSSITYSEGYIEVKKNQIGFHTGATIDININENIAFFASGAYRFVKSEPLIAQEYYKNNKGEKLIKDATLYYAVNKLTGEARFMTSKPSETDWNFHKAQWKLNGFVLNAGIKITLGSIKKSELPKNSENE